jgi:hypothetical protein
MTLLSIFNRKNTSKPDKTKLIQKLIKVLKAIKANIHDDADCTWSYYETPQKARNEIDQYISELEKGNINSLPEISVHFAPTSAYQELSLQNNWSKEYLKLSTQFDKIQGGLKNCS